MTKSRTAGIIISMCDEKESDSSEMEKRAATRIVFNVKSRVKYDKKTVEGNVINLSMHGMLLSSGQDIPVGKTVKAEIFMEGTTSKLKIKVKGRVLRSDRTGTAITFKSVDIDSFIHLKNIIAYNEGDVDKIMKEFYKSIKQDRKC